MAEAPEVPIIWKRYLSPEQLREILTTSRKRSEDEKRENEIKDLEKEKQKVGLLAEIRKKRREAMAEEKNEATET